jgi:hypothetical protein
MERSRDAMAGNGGARRGEERGMANVFRVLELAI